MCIREPHNNDNIDNLFNQPNSKSSKLLNLKFMKGLSHEETTENM